MPSWPTRLTSLAAAFALSGCPTVISACMALCLHAAPMTVMADEQGSCVQQAPASTTTGASGSHHGSPAARVSPASADARGSADQSPALSDARLGDFCHDCCAHARAGAAVAGRRAVGTDAHAADAAAMVGPMRRNLVTSPMLGAASHHAPKSPPPPGRAPLVLRI
jgi:hypothetical protein